MNPNFITKKNLPAFKKAYKQALRDNAETFWFEKNQILTDYAKYVIEYFELILNKKENIS